MDDAFEDNFDPFSSLPKSGKNTSELLRKAPEDKPKDLEESKHYVSLLEGKLSKLKEPSAKTLNSKAVMKSLHGALSGQMKSILDTRNTVEAGWGDMEVDFAESLHTNPLKRRVFPEQPLTPEELQLLVANDCLSLVTQSENDAADEQEKLPESL